MQPVYCCVTNTIINSDEQKICYKVPHTSEPLASRHSGVNAITQLGPLTECHHSPRALTGHHPLARPPYLAADQLGASELIQAVRTPTAARDLISWSNEASVPGQDCRYRRR